MAIQNCEVIGCPRPAEWQHTLHSDSHAEQYLCCPHWSYLHVCAPAKVMFYIPMFIESEIRTTAAVGAKPEAEGSGAAPGL